MSQLEDLTALDDDSISPDERRADEQSEVADSAVLALPPQADSDLLPVVGLGGSAGSIAPLQEFFSLLPPDTGMAFVVVVHLAPASESLLPQILQARTAMPVVQVREPVQVEANHVYVIPPAQHLSMRDGRIELSQPDRPAGQRVAVDLFFRTLAQTHRSRAVAVVLSGTDGDGAVGIGRIKAHGGVTLVQDPDEAEHSGMPAAALETGMVDWVLPVAQMPARLVEFARNEAKQEFPPVEAPPRSPDADPRGSLLRETEIASEDLKNFREESAAVEHALIANLPGGAVFIVGRDGRYLLAQGEALEMAGLTSADFVGKTLDEALPPDVAAAYRPLLERALEGEPFSCEHQSHGRWYLSRGVPLSDPNGVNSVLVVSYDITECKESENALRASETRLQMIIESVTDYSIITTDESGVINGWNAGAHKIFGWTREEAIGQSGALIFTPEDRAAGRVEEEMRLARERGRAEDERWHLRKDGTRIYVSGVMSPLRDGYAEGYVKIARDLTERQRGEAALRESEARFRTLSDAVPQIIWTNEAAGRAIYFNSRWFDYSGLTFEQSQGPGWQTIVHPDDAPAAVERWQAALAAGDVFDVEYRLRRHDGQYRWFIGRNVPLRDEGGAVLGWFGTATDIQEFKEAQSALRSSEERLRIAIAAGGLGTWDWDLKRDEVRWSPRHFLLLGLEPSEGLVVPGAFLEYVHPDDRVRIETALRDAVNAMTVYDEEFRIVRADNRQVRWMSGYGQVVELENGNATRISGVMFDSTERHEARALLQRAHDELEERVATRTAELQTEIIQRQFLERERERLLRGIVAAQEEERRRLSRELHDQMGQTLTALALGLTMLPVLETDESETGQATPAQRLQGLQDLTSELADYAHHLAWELRPAVLDNVGLEAALQQYVRDWSKRTDVAADFVAHGLSGRLAPDVESTLYRVAQEAMSNVARHANASQLGVLLERRGDEVIMVIEDNGQGFDPKQPSGRLGLVGMRERLELVGGTLDIESAPNNGTTIYARVPIKTTLH